METITKPRPKLMLREGKKSEYSRYNCDSQTKSRITNAAHVINSSPVDMPCSASTIVRMAVARFAKQLQEDMRRLETLPEMSREWIELWKSLRDEVKAANNSGDGVRRKGT